MKLSFYGNTNVGRQRDHNEDSFLILCDIDDKWQEVNNIEIDLSKSKGVIFVVADGMGGANAGEVASDIAVKTVKEKIIRNSSLPADPSEVQKLLKSIVIEGHNKIVKASLHNEVMEGMGTTIVMGFMFKDTLYTIWSGDSRCYVYNKKFDKGLSPFTDDHSLVWERVRNKELNPEEARLSDESNLILQSLGGALLRPEPDFKWIKLKNNDRILLCSDGLNSMLSSVGIQQILDFNSSAQETCESLIQAANNAGGRDNITAVVIDVSDDSEIITEPGSHEKQIIKKKPKILPVLLILSLIVVCGIYFRFEIAHFFGSLLIRDIQPVIMNSPSLADTGKPDIMETGVKSVTKNDIAESDTNKNIIGATRDTLSSDSNRMPLDSSFIETQLREAALKIVAIKNNIKMVEPDGFLFKSDFYHENKVKLDSIKNMLAPQEKLLKSVAYLNINNIIIKITDFAKANEIYEELINTLTELEKRTDDIING